MTVEVLPAVSAVAPWLPFAQAALLVLLIAVIAGSVFYVWRRARIQAAKAAQAAQAKKPNGDEPAPDEAPAAPTPRRAASLFTRRALGRLETLTGVPDQPYQLPWFAVIGSEGASVTRLLDGLEFSEATVGPFDPEVIPGRAARFCRDGLLLELESTLLSETLWEVSWKAFIRELIRHRPDRPLDGLVVVLPVTDLIGPEPLPADRLANVADRLYQLIWSMQSLTGLRVPIYLILSRCEELPGFLPLVDTLPEDLRDEILGWPVPYALDTAFSPEWVDEGIADLTSRISELKLQLLMQVADPEDADRIFLFPGRVGAIRDPLKILLKGMLQESAYHEAFMFRGFFATGLIDVPAQPNMVPDLPSGESTGPNSQGAAFLKKLFSEKIFREYRMAQPARGALSVRRKRIRWTQAALVVFLVIAAVGLFSVANTRDRNASVAELISVVRDEVDQVIRVRPIDGAEDASMIYAATMRLLNTMGRVSVGHVETIAAPTSYLTDAENQIEAAIASGYDLVVLLAIRNGLVRKLAEILEPVAGGAARSSGAETSQQAAGQLKKLVDSLKEYDGFLDAYAELGETKSIIALANLVAYTMGKTVPEGFRRNYVLYKDALGKTAPTLDRAKIKQIAAVGLEGRFDAVVEAQYMNSGLFQSLSQYSDLAKRLSSDPKSSDAGSARALVHELGEALQAIKRDIGSPEYNWLDHDDTAIGNEIATALADLERLSFVSSEMVDNLKSLVQLRLAEARAKVFALTGFGGRLLFERSANGSRLNPTLTEAMAVLDDMHQQSFMESMNAGASLPVGAQSGRIVWDARTVQKAVDATENYLVFEERLNTLPVDIRDAIARLAELRLSAFVDGHIREARGSMGGAQLAGGWQAAGALRDEVLNFSAVEPLLSNLRMSLVLLGLNRPLTTLNDTATRQAERLLREIDSRLREARPYRPQDPTFSFWFGEEPFAAEAFGVANDADLAALLDSRRAYIGQLAAEFAVSVVDYLDGDPNPEGQTEAVLTTKWSGIVRVVEASMQNYPGNALAQLDRFILADMNKITVENCSEQTASAGRPSNWFEQQLRTLKQDISGRCEDIQRDEIGAAYARVRLTFNEELAGYFPFIGMGGNAGPLAVSDVPASDPNTVRQFFVAHQTDLDTLTKDAHNKQLFGKTETAAASFIDELDRVRTVLAPMLVDPTLSAPLIYSLSVDFRTNADKDIAGNQIIEWTLRVGDSTLSSFDTKRQILWTVGEPVTVSLRWAGNAPLIPEVSLSASSPVANGITAVFAYDGTWSILRLLAHHSLTQSDAIPLQNRRPQALVFKVPLRLNPDAALGGTDTIKEAQVYMRIGLSAVMKVPGKPEQQVPVTLPFFPAAAPTLNSEWRT